MANVLVNIVSQQVVQNYLFIRQFYKNGDKLVFFHTKKFMSEAQNVLNTLFNEKIVIDDDDVKIIELEEEDWPSMIECVESSIDDDNYLVNLTGGTKYMSLAVQKAFEKAGSCTFYYLPYPKNIFLNPNNESPIKITHHVSINEYMSVHNVKYTVKHPVNQKKYSYSFFDLYTKHFTDNDYLVINKLREYRNYGVEDVEYISKNNYVKVTNKGKKNEKERILPQISGLYEFLCKINYPMGSKSLSKEDVQYLSGGWFEEYVYYIIQDNVKPDDIAIGLFVKQQENANTNDLDVVFTKGNKLFVIECKTAIPKTEEKGETAMFREISYKAASIKASLLKLPGNSFICSLNKGNEDYKTLANNMGIRYFDGNFFLEKEKEQEFYKEIIKIANI